MICEISIVHAKSIVHARRVERKTYHHRTQIRQSELCITGRKRGALEGCIKVRRAKKLRGGNAKWHTQLCTSSRARGLPGENCSVQ